jgi:hypothetical protein
MSDEQREREGQRETLIKALSVAVPAVSFGSILVNVLLQQMGLLADPGSFGVGQLAGAILLAALAWLMPRKDIVSLIAPVYALLIFVLPLELQPNLLTQFLFAASMSVLVIRLNHSFSKPRVSRSFEPIEDLEIEP